MPGDGPHNLGCAPQGELPNCVAADLASELTVPSADLLGLDLGLGERDDHVVVILPRIP